VLWNRYKVADLAFDLNDFDQLGELKHKDYIIECFKRSLTSNFITNIFAHDHLDHDFILAFPVLK